MCSSKLRTIARFCYWIICEMIENGKIKSSLDSLHIHVIRIQMGNGSKPHYNSFFKLTTHNIPCNERGFSPPLPSVCKSLYRTHIICSLCIHFVWCVLLAVSLFALYTCVNMLIIPKQTARIQWHMHTQHSNWISGSHSVNKFAVAHFDVIWFDFIYMRQVFAFPQNKTIPGIKEPSEVTCAIDFVGSHTKISKAKTLHIRINAPNVNLIKCWSNIQSHYQYMLTKSLLSSKPNSIHSLHPFHSIGTCAFFSSFDFFPSRLPFDCVAFFSPLVLYSN